MLVVVEDLTENEFVYDIARWGVSSSLVENRYYLPYIIRESLIIMLL